MKRNIVSPLAASRTNSNKADFYTAYSLREWALVKKIRRMIDEDTCGELCSLRFMWQKPKQNASDNQTFLYETVAGLLDAAWLLANSSLASLHIEKVTGKNNLFGLAMFNNGITAEIEANECLPNSMPATYFIKANFNHGHISNQPLVGHFNEEGSILANDSSCQRLIIENSDWDNCVDEIALCRRSMQHAIENNTYPSGPLHSVAIVNAINAALEK